MRPPNISLRLSLKNFLLICVCLFLSGTRTFLRAQQTTPSMPDELTRGIELYRQGSYSDTVKLMRALSKKQKDNADAWHYLGLALMKQDKVKDASKAFETAVKLRPQFAAAQVGLAYVSFLGNKPYEATRAVEAALKLEPQNAEAHYISGVIAAQSQSYTRALDEAEVILKRQPNYAPALYLKTFALFGLSGNALNSASDETPDVRAVLLSKITERLDEAAAALERWQKIEPSSPKVAEMREELATLQLYRTAFNKPANERDVLSAKEVTTKARILSKAEPQYTERARQNGVTGEVVLRVVLAWNATVQNIFAVKRLPDGLTETAVKAAQRIKFIPAMKDGRPVSQYATIVYNFNIY